MDLGQQYANEIDADLMEDLKVKDDMNAVRLDFNKREANYDYT